jgi:23S rRNA (uracil1939-C5)-methyltransferase
VQGGGDTLFLRWTASDGPLCWSQADGPPLSRLTENTAIGDLLVPSRSFFQVNPAVADMLLGVVGGIIESISPKTVIDLYCGVGGMTFAASRSSAEFLLGIDSDARAIRAARRNAVSLGVENTEFVSGKAAELLDEAVEAVDASQLAVIVDPPRRGLEKEVIEILGRRRPATVVYVSCGADTMARDTRMLVEHGYGVVETGVVDMFPRTAHFESVTVFSQ